MTSPIQHTNHTKLPPANHIDINVSYRYVSNRQKQTATLYLTRMLTTPQVAQLVAEVNLINSGILILMKHVAVDDINKLIKFNKPDATGMSRIEYVLELNSNPPVHIHQIIYKIPTCKTYICIVSNRTVCHQPTSTTKPKIFPLISTAVHTQCLAVE